mgnify:CR=1 FL=1|tara:strand:- start:38 stop:406 length:369 start_codon:yes stop_codon:yes gene_type:complete
MAFKLGSEKRGFKGPKDTPILRTDLKGSVQGEANNDGTIMIDSNIPVDSKKFEKAVKHEMKHIEQMETGKAAYGEDWVMWKDDIFFRKKINGISVIDGPNGRWPDGHPNHPWEQEAIQAENE